MCTSTRSRVPQLACRRKWAVSGVGGRASKTGKTLLRVCNDAPRWSTAPAATTMSGPRCCGSGKRAVGLHQMSAQCPACPELIGPPPAWEMPFPAGGRRPGRDILVTPTSWTITFCSRRNSSGSKVGSDRMSERTSSASGTVPLSTRAKFIELPLCRSVEISAADRFDRFGDLSRCAALGAFKGHMSDKCEMPCSSACSLRLPEQFLAERCRFQDAAFRSVTTDNPDARRVISTLMPLLLHAPHARRHYICFNCRLI